MTNLHNSVEIAECIYWVGECSNNGSLQCNPYLLIDGEDGIIVDPGSVLDFDTVYNKITELIPIEKIKYIVLSHQDPDLCSSIPLFEERGLKAKIATHWRTSTLVKYYGVKSDFYIINENGNKLILDSGRIIRFINTPYLHFAGSIAAYDTKTKTLFSGDLFGSLSNKWDLYADETYIGGMKSFHEHYMPSNRVIRPVMEFFLSMDISIIAPQHGCIINNDIKKYITVLRDLECGLFMNPIKKELAISGGYMAICNEVLKRLYSIFDVNDVKNIFNDNKIVLDNTTSLIVDFNLTGEELWNYIFDSIYDKRGTEWLETVQPFVSLLIKKYDIKAPKAFRLYLDESKKLVKELVKENNTLREENKKLSVSLINVEEKLLKCSITGLYNFEFFRQYLSIELGRKVNNSQNACLMIIEADNTDDISIKFGQNESNEILKLMAYLLNEFKDTSHFLARADGTNFAYYIPNTDAENSLIIAENIRNTVDKSSLFIEHITVSIGIVNLNEFSSTKSHIFETIYNAAKLRLKLAKNNGGNSVCNESNLTPSNSGYKKIYLIDTTISSLGLLQNYLNKMGLEVVLFNDGKAALDAIEMECPDLIVSEIMIPQIDGFALREKMLLSSTLKKIPFILVSHLKDEEQVNRAVSLGINYYYKKPFMLSELLGVIRNILGI